MESIMAVGNCRKNERTSAGIIFGWLYDRENQKYGGLVCEHQGDYSPQEIGRKLRASLDELYYNGFSETHNLRDIKLISETFVPKKEFGTAIVALCFTNYFYPVISASL